MNRDTLRVFVGELLEIDESYSSLRPRDTLISRLFIGKEGLTENELKILTPKEITEIVTILGNALKIRQNKIDIIHNVFIVIRDKNDIIHNEIDFWNCIKEENQNLISFLEAQISGLKSWNAFLILAKEMRENTLSIISAGTNSSQLGKRSMGAAECSYYQDNIVPILNPPKEKE